MINLGSWMNKVLTGWGVDEKIANTFDEAIIAILLVAVAIGLDYLCQAIFVGDLGSPGNRQRPYHRHPRKTRSPSSRDRRT